MNQPMKGITCCADCAYYNMKRHRCTRASDEGKPTDHFYADCPLPTVTPEPGWIPFVKRPLTEDEQKNHPEWCYILDGAVPEDEQEILLCRPWRNAEGYIIEMDRYCNNGDECYLEGACDIENGMYWMPLPKPPKEDTP